MKLSAITVARYLAILAATAVAGMIAAAFCFALLEALAESVESGVL